MNDLLTLDDIAQLWRVTREHARRAMLEGATEVRGIFLPPELHQALKEAAKKLAAAHKKNPPV